MRRAIALLLVLITIPLIALNASAVTCDGYDEGYEWDSASTLLLLNGSGNCNVNQGVARFLIDNKNNAVYICLILNDKLLEQGNTDAGFVLYIGNNDYIKITLNGIEKHYDNYKYSFDGEMSINENGGAFAEIKVGFKSGVPQKIKGKARFIDYSGEPSDYCNFELVNTEYSEPTAATVYATTANYNATKPVSTTKVKTTKEKTTKEKSTKEKTTKKSTTKRTTAKKSSFEFDIDFPDIVLNEEKTESRKTLHSTTEIQENTEKNVTIYYVEKEVIISQVYITSAELPSESDASVQASVYYATATETLKKTEQIEKGMKYKSVIVVACAACFAGAVIWCVADAKKKSSLKNQSEKKDDNE